MSYNLETRVEKLERRQPTALEQMTDAELEARMAYLDELIFEQTGIHCKHLSILELRALAMAPEGSETERTVIEQLRIKQQAELTVSQ